MIPQEQRIKEAVSKKSTYIVSVSWTLSICQSNLPEDILVDWMYFLRGTFLSAVLCTKLQLHLEDFFTPTMPIVNHQTHNVNLIASNLPLSR